MYYLFSVLTGILIAVMIAVNGELGTNFGLYTSTAIIHFVGLIFVTLVLVLKKKNPKNPPKDFRYIFTSAAY